MSLISVTALSKSHGAIDIFTNLTFSIDKGIRLGIVGPNGVGKTSLLRILAGEDEASAGTVNHAKGVRIGYLSQEANFKMEGTLWDACHSVFDNLNRQEQELRRLEELMTTNIDVIEQYGELLEDFEKRGGYTYEVRIQQVLAGLGFIEADYSLLLDQLSGGQRTRAFLARLLLSSPDVLLLDEPTNHLDTSAVEWLEHYLARWKGTAIIVSHDRYFLDTACSVIMEMLTDTYEIYNGNYSAYLKQREERNIRRQEVFDLGKETLLKEIEYIRRNIAGQNSRQAKGRLKRLSRLIQSIEQIGFEVAFSQKWSETVEEINISSSSFSVDEAQRRILSLHSPVRALPHLHLRLEAQKSSGELVLHTRNLQVGFAGDVSLGTPRKLLFKTPDIELHRQECAALIGPNGAGKTTFLKTILGQLEPLTGEVVLGTKLQIGYFGQTHEGLNPSRTLLEEISHVREMSPSKVRDYLAKYLFSGDDVFKKVGVLSGGERARLALAVLALQDTNLLLLDEPTNHLDIPSQEILQSVLDDYNGTILLVTHDRYLVDALATQIWEINIAEAYLTVFRGTYSEMKKERTKQIAPKIPTSQIPKSKKTKRKSSE